MQTHLTAGCALQVLCFGPVAILTHIIKQKSFNHCTTGPYLINRVPLLPVPEQHLSRTRPYPQRSSGYASTWSVTQMVLCDVYLTMLSASWHDCLGMGRG